MSSEMETVNMEEYGSVHIRNASCLASLAVLLYEHSITFAQEYQFVWKSRPTLVKWVYLFSRYFVIVVQIINNILLALPLSKLPIRHELCKPWFLFLMISTCISFAALEVVLMLRVYALYRRSPRVKNLFIAIFVINRVVVADYTRRASSFPFGGACEITGMPHDMMIFLSILLILTQSIIWLLTVIKRNITYGRAPVVGLMIRDGAWIFVLVCGVFIVTFPYALTERASKSHVIFLWPMSLFSIGTCRIILNMQSLNYPGAKSKLTSSDMSTNVEVDFTQCIDISLQSTAISQRRVGRNSDTIS
ncbi:hypothetical protein BDQ12DRAFT_715858 [Crucibulum laeve]|uniref:DUF6533 domain-containing protein n=1 Tax=Crucibulum laeve TaxID=68775 RepID=A0A5C3LX51_9AGAR|nr:hypothetical protein BDQ12DRAFT_715858 [Crucibulum laeve]